MFSRRRYCSCMYNNDNTVSVAQNAIETNCQNTCNCNNNCYENDDCECGYDEEMGLFPENPSLAQSYVPFQYLNKTFIPEVALRMGTLYPELVSPYVPGQSMDEIAYLEKSNEIGEGCNKCQ